jgi:zinc and cadmium transporter
MPSVWIYSLVSVFLISLISLIGIIAIGINTKLLRKILVYMVSFSAGALLGDVFIHLLPELVEEHGFTLQISIYIMLGIGISFIIEKFIHWRHCHIPTSEDHVHPFALMNLVGDFVHNFIDGLILGAAYLISIPAGIATTIALILHEIPQEIGDFGVLLHGGFSKSKALFLNFVTALSAVAGVVIALVLGSLIENIDLFLIPFAAGTFIYIAGSDLIPELHKETEVKKSAIQFLFLVLGIAIMFLLVFLG